MNQEALMQIVEAIGPEALLALIQMLMQMSEEELGQLIQGLQQAAQAEAGGGEPAPDQGQQNLYG